MSSIAADLCAAFVIIVWWCHDIETLSTLLAFVRVIYRSPVDSLHEGPVMQSFLFPLMSAWTAEQTVINMVNWDAWCSFDITVQLK